MVSIVTVLKYDQENIHKALGVKVFDAKNYLKLATFLPIFFIIIIIIFYKVTKA